MHLAEFVLASARRACVAPHGEECSRGAISQNAALAIVILAGVLVYVAVSISNIVKKEPLPRRRNTHRSTRRHSADNTTAGRLENAAEYTGDRERPFAWMDIGTITGKLTFGAWISRWWSSGSYMRRRLLVSIGTALLTVALVGGFIALTS